MVTKAAGGLKNSPTNLTGTPVFRNARLMAPAWHYELFATKTAQKD